MLSISLDKLKEKHMSNTFKIPTRLHSCIKHEKLLLITKRISIMSEWKRGKHSTTQLKCYESILVLEWFLLFRVRKICFEYFSSHNFWFWFKFSIFWSIDSYFYSSNLVKVKSFCMEWLFSRNETRICAFYASSCRHHVSVYIFLCIC